jgi:hypothetical protein
MKQIIKNMTLSSLLVFGGAVYAMEKPNKEQCDLLSYTCLMDEACQTKGAERTNTLDKLIQDLQSYEKELEKKQSSNLSAFTNLRIMCQDALREGVEDEMYQIIAKK